MNTNELTVSPYVRWCGVGLGNHMIAALGHAVGAGERISTKISPATFLTCLCLLAFTACSTPQSTSTPDSIATGPTKIERTATSGQAINPTEDSGERALAAVESGGDTLDTAWVSEGSAATPPLVTPARRAKTPTFDSHILVKNQLADASGAPVTATVQDTNEAGDTATGGTAEPKLQIAASQSADLDLATLAQQTNNPIGEAWLLITQNDTTLLKGDAIDGEEVLNVTKFMPVLSAPILGGDWNLVVRPVLQFSSVPVNDNVGDLFGVSPNDIVADPSLSAIATDPFGRTNGLGDTVLLTLAGPNADDGWIFAGGVSQIFPTASEDVLGQGKWQAGPAAMVIRLGNDYGGFGIEHFNAGFIAQQWWSYAGDDDRNSTNQADIQYFINWKATPTQLIGMTPNISINWDADGGFDDKVAFPVGLGTIGLFRIGKLPIRWGVEAQYYLTGPDTVRREANFRFFIAPIIPNLLK
jgi:hypothetical protein